MQAGDAFNLIPDTATLSGTVRALTGKQMTHIRARMDALVQPFAAAYGCNGTINWRLNEQPYYPPTVNDDKAAAFAWDVASRLLGEEQVTDCSTLDKMYAVSLCNYNSMH